MTWGFARVALIAAHAVLFSAAGWAAEENWIQLRDGVQARFITATESDKKPRTLVASFALSDASVVSDHVKVIEVADQLFGRIVLLAAEEKGFKHAVVNILISETKTDDGAKQTYEDFHYGREKNAVWLRKAGPQSWKTAQDKNWTPPAPEVVQMRQGKAYIDFIGEIFPPSGATKALGIEMRSDTAITNIQGKYDEIRELWSRLDRTKLTNAGFDFVHIENYSEPLRGKFQVRKRIYVDIRRGSSGDWPALPETPPLGEKAPVTAGLGDTIDDDPVRFAAAAVNAAMLADERPGLSEGVTASIGMSLRMLRQATKDPTTLEYFKSDK